MFLGWSGQGVWWGGKGRRGKATRVCQHDADVWGVPGIVDDAAAALSPYRRLRPHTLSHTPPAAHAPH
jgi:hypothetical protein